jgi:Ca2+-binding EF-hand superfamily protein
MTTAVRNDRMQQRFDLWDTDNDGKITRDDYQAEARRILKGFGEPEASPRARALVEAYTAMWDHLAAAAGVGPDGSLTPQQFQDVCEQEVFSHGPTGFASVVRPTIQAMVSIADTDGDNQINPQEFRNWLKAIGVDQTHADQAFQEIDTNGDGQLQIDELVSAVRRHNFGELDIPLLGR